MSHTSDISNEDLLFYAENELPASRMQQIESHVGHCEQCRQRLSSLQLTLGSIGQLAEELEGVDLLSGVKAEIARVRPITPRRFAVRRWLVGGGAMGAVAAAAIVLVMLPGELVEKNDGFTARSAVSELSIGAWLGVTAYRVVDDSAVLLGDSMKSTESLAFTYTNAGDAPFNFLSVVGVDAKGGLHWYYPAYTREGTDPVSIPIQPGVKAAELPDQVKHELAPGPMAVLALFSKEPLRVSQVEAEIRAARKGGQAAWGERPLPFEDMVQQSILIDVLE